MPPPQDSITRTPLTRPVNGTITPPGSKSITNRALLCAAFAEGTTNLYGVLNSEDTQVMVNALASLSTTITGDIQKGALSLSGNHFDKQGKNTQKYIPIFVENSGTTIRFLTAALAIRGGRYLLDGIERMRDRPIGDLLEALSKIGCQVRSLKKPGCPPVQIDPHGELLRETVVRGNISSQYLSGLLMAAPLSQTSLSIRVEGELVSRPYITMTTEVMKAFGVTVDYTPDLSSFYIPAEASYQGTDYSIEPDASAASYFWAAAAITNGTVTVCGLHQNSLQGDIDFCGVLQKMGAVVDYQEKAITVTGKSLHGIDIDMGTISDTVQTLAAVALFAKGKTTITGVAHNRHKETDRITDLATELRKLGATVEESSDGLSITPPQKIEPTIIETYNDHRMAMSLALVGLRVPGITILNPGCTAKTYPNFFNDLASLCGE
ncbi:MAG: 3-phosphoshikimate 1-carboxyvinyltransferase [Pirellulaceae bacterium]|nr:3-phosphoshikimate 1-carboxyvinyltransferase [Pirellulaceae bacterium]